MMKTVFAAAVSSVKTSRRISIGCGQIRRVGRTLQAGLRPRSSIGELILIARCKENTSGIQERRFDGGCHENKKSTTESSKVHIDERIPSLADRKLILDQPITLLGNLTTCNPSHLPEHYFLFQFFLLLRAEYGLCLQFLLLEYSILNLCL